MFHRLLALAFFTTFSLQALEYGAQSMVTELKKVLVKRPDPSFAVLDPDFWHYIATPILEIAQAEHDSFMDILKKEGVEIIHHDTYAADLADSIYVHDPVIITKKGAIILQMGKPLREGECYLMERQLNQLGIPTYFKMHGQATCEGGDTLWLDEKTATKNLYEYRHVSQAVLLTVRMTESHRQLSRNVLSHRPDLADLWIGVLPPESALQALLEVS